MTHNQPNLMFEFLSVEKFSFPGKWIKSLVSLLLLASSSAYSALPTMPSSGTCAMLSRYEIPFGIDVAARGSDGYPFSSLTTFTFTSATAGTFSSLDVSIDFRTTDGPTARNWGLARDVAFTLTPMEDGVTGIAGGYLMQTVAYDSSFFNTTGELLQGDSEALPQSVIHVFPVNGGRTLLMQGGSFPFTGVCQF